MLEFPENWVIGPAIARAVGDWVDWLVINGDQVFRTIKWPILQLIKGFEWLLLIIPWWIILALASYLAWRTAGVSVAIFTVISLTLMSFIGMHDLAMETLAIVITATFISVFIGMPLGILSAKNTRFGNVMRPILDGMQTMPSFVYLIPALMLFGLGRVPAILATCVYALPPMIRLTELGIKQVDPGVLEAARAFGSTPLQILSKVQLPMALPSIMAGVNQTIMMALAMVVIASMIGAGGLGIEVLNGIARLDIGRGFLGGMGIVIVAIIIDRVTQGLTRSRRARSSN